MIQISSVSYCLGYKWTFSQNSLKKKKWKRHLIQTSYNCYDQHYDIISFYRYKADCQLGINRLVDRLTASIQPLEPAEPANHPTEILNQTKLLDFLILQMNQRTRSKLYYTALVNATSSWKNNKTVLLLAFSCKPLNWKKYEERN